MNRLGTLTLLLCLAGLAPALPAGAETGGMKHDMQAMKPGDAAGREIHRTMRDGFHLSYRLIDMKERMAAAGGTVMEGHDMSAMKSHHLMLYIVGPDGKKVTEARVGYMVTGPDGTVQKAMAMAMQGAFGADVDLKGKGRYTVKAKAVFGDRKLVDEFSYVVD